jgi:hypothetical protein
LGAQGRLWADKFTYGLGGTLNNTSTDDDTVDQRTMNYYFNLDYKIADQLWGYITPVIGLRGESNEIQDDINDTTTRDYSFTLVFSTSSLFSF